jgi:hypothetical protein
MRRWSLLRLLMLLVTMANGLLRSRRDLLLENLALRQQLVVLNTRHLKQLMRLYIRYYHGDRTHLGLNKETPAGRRALNPGANGKVISIPRLGGLHHRYDLAA